MCPTCEYQVISEVFTVIKSALSWHISSYILYPVPVHSGIKEAGAGALKADKEMEACSWPLEPTHSSKLPAIKPMLLNFCDYIHTFFSVYPWSLFLSVPPASHLRWSMGMACTPSISLFNILKVEWAPLRSQTHDQQRSCLMGTEVCKQKKCMLHQKGASRKSHVLFLPYIRSPGSRMVGVTRKRVTNSPQEDATGPGWELQAFIWFWQSVNLGGWGL